MKIPWIIKRLTAMSAKEIIHRSIFWIKMNLWRKAALENKAFFNCYPCRQFTESPFLTGHIDRSTLQVQHLISEADSYLKHRWNFFNLQDIAEPDINWHFDPSTNTRAPEQYSFDINHRKTEIAGDAKILWEKNRHHHLTVLGAAFILTKNENYALEVSTQILDWIEQNKCLMGINWTHPLELGIRLISWVWCERFLRGSIHYNKVFGSKSPVWLTIGQHQELIAKTYSVGSSANNHLIGEMAGLLITSLAFPIYKKSVHWQILAKKILEEEIGKQTFPSGINKELAFGYQIFVAEFLLLSVYETRRVNSNFSDNFHSLLRKSLEVVVQLTDYGRNMPRYGDDDDGMAVQLQARSQSRAPWVLQIGSILLDAPLSSCKDTALPVLLMGYNRDFAKENSPPHQECISYSDAGVYVLSNNRNTPKEIFIVADAGPLGYLSLAAHGHADALSFTLSAGGKVLFCDPGTYNYYTDEKWRNYFRSTRCHNTVVIDDKDQSKLQGKFLWSHKAKTSLKNWASDTNGATLTASHDGYLQSAGCEHTRSFILSKNKLTILDTLSGTKEHKVCLCFHCPPQCIVLQESPHILRITNEPVSATISLPRNLRITLHKAEASAGWYSPHFGVKVPSFSILAEASGTFPLELSTVIEVIYER